MANKVYLYVKALSDLGSRMEMIVLGALIFATTQSVAWLSASLAVSVLGGMLSSLVSGVVADQYDRRKIMIITDVLRAGLILLLIPFPEPVMILVVRFFMGVSGSFFEVSYNAEVPQIYGKQNLLRTNAIISRLGAVTMVFGFLGGGYLQHLFGYESVVLLDSCSFLLSMLVLLRLRWDPARNYKEKISGPEIPAPWHRLRKQLDDLREVKAYLWVRPALLLVFMVYVIDTFGSGSHNLGVPLLAAEIDQDRQALFYGLIWAVWGSGNVLTTYLLPHLSWLRGNLYRVYLISTPFMSLGFIAIFLTTELPWVLSAAFVTGVFDACSVTTATTLFQKSDNWIRGRVFGVSLFLNRMGFLFGFIAAPLIMQVMSLSHMVMLFHGIVISVAVAAIVIYQFQSGSPQFMDRSVRHGSFNAND